MTNLNSDFINLLFKYHKYIIIIPVINTIKVNYRNVTFDQ